MTNASGSSERSLSAAGLPLKSDHLVQAGAGERQDPPSARPRAEFDAWTYRHPTAPGWIRTGLGSPGVRREPSSGPVAKSVGSLYVHRGDARFGCRSVAEGLKWGPGQAPTEAGQAPTPPSRSDWDRIGCRGAGHRRRHSRHVHHRLRRSTGDGFRDAPTATPMIRAPGPWSGPSIGPSGPPRRVADATGPAAAKDPAFQSRPRSRRCLTASRC